jgi:hypothetical protein
MAHTSPANHLPPGRRYRPSMRRDTAGRGHTALAPSQRSAAIGPSRDAPRASTATRSTSPHQTASTAQTGSSSSTAGPGSRSNACPNATGSPPSRAAASPMAGSPPINPVERRPSHHHQPHPCFPIKRFPPSRCVTRVAVGGRRSEAPERASTPPSTPDTRIIPVHVPRTAANRRDRSATVVDSWAPEAPKTDGLQTAPRAYPVADSIHWRLLDMAGHHAKRPPIRVSAGQGLFSQRVAGVGFEPT